jgi:hypothetical protein
MSGVGLRKDGLPKALGPLNDLFQSKDTTSLRFGLTLMCIGKPITLPVKPKLEDIADKWTGTLHDGVMEYIPTFVEKLRKPYMEWETPHWSTKSGPNGHALGMALKEFLALPYFITQALLALGGEDFRDYINKLRKALKVTEAEKNVKFRRLHFLQDKEGKTRTIAILDYWSQTVLKPYHDGVMKILRKLPGDFTYQGDFRSWLEQGTGTYYSMDLTAATDRFPLEFQKKLLEVMWGPKKAMAWAFLMSGLPFEYTLEGETKTISYGSGQPMGAYSSWAVFAMCHHLILQYVKSVHNETVYAILGDDVVIRGDKGATLYREVMSTLGVDISVHKTHISKDSYEFAKRWITGGVEVTPFPIWSIIEAGTSYIKLATALRDTHRKGWTAENICRSDVISQLLVRIQGVQSRSAANMARNAMVFLKTLDIISYDGPPGEITTKVISLAMDLGIDTKGHSWCLHEKHLIGSLQRALNDASAAIAHQAVESLDNAVASLVGCPHQDIHSALFSLHPAVRAAESLLESTTDGALFYRDLAAYHRAGLKTTGIPLDEKFSSLAKILPVSKIPDPSAIFSERTAVQVVNNQAKLVKITRTEWATAVAHPELDNLRSEELGRVLANASRDLHRA